MLNVVIINCHVIYVIQAVGELPALFLAASVLSQLHGQKVE